jgi:hypothetical protein
MFFKHSSNVLSQKFIKSHLAVTVIPVKAGIVEGRVSISPLQGGSVYYASLQERRSSGFRNRTISRTTLPYPLRASRTEKPRWAGLFMWGSALGFGNYLIADRL